MQRQKNIVRLRTVGFVSVHKVTGNSIRVDPNHDMVMIHFKAYMKKNDGIPIVLNPFVYKALNKALFCV